MALIACALLLAGCAGPGQPTGPGASPAAPEHPDAPETTPAAPPAPTEAPPAPSQEAPPPSAPPAAPPSTPAPTDAGATPAPPAPSASPSIAAPSTAEPIARVADVPPGTTREFTHQGRKAILVNIDGQFRAYVNSCTHAGGPNDLKEGSLVCKWHGSRFDPLTGAVQRGPATRPIEPIPLVVRDGAIHAA